MNSLGRVSPFATKMATVQPLLEKPEEKSITHDGANKQTSLDLSNSGCTDEMLDSIMKEKHLTHLNLSGNDKITATGLHKLSALPLQELYLDYLAIDDEACRALQKQLHLTTLSLAHTEVTKEQLQLLPTTIETLILSSCRNLTHQTLSFEHLPHLRSLVLHETSFEFAPTFDALQKNVHLRSLDISKGYSFNELNEEAQKALAQLSQLTELNISYANLAREDVIHLLKQLPNVTRFHFEGAHHHPHLLLKEFRAFPQLTLLHLSGHTVTHPRDVLRSEKTLTCTGPMLGETLVNLQELYFGRCGDTVSDEHVANLGTFGKLTTLDLRGCGITQKTFEALPKQFPVLEKLYVGPVSENDLQAVLQYTHVVSLVLDHCTISETSAKLLSQAKHIKHIDVATSKLSDAARACLQEKLPVHQHPKLNDQDLLNQMNGRDPTACIIL